MLSAYSCDKQYKHFYAPVAKDWTVITENQLAYSRTSYSNRLCK